MSNSVASPAPNPTLAAAGSAPALRAYAPNADIAESADAYYVQFDLPGVESEGLEVSVERGELTVQGSLSLAGYEGLTPVYTEQRIGDFRRSFRLGTAVDSERIEAQLRDGVLQLVLPKSQAARSRRIEVRAN